MQVIYYPSNLFFHQAFTQQSQPKLDPNSQPFVPVTKKG